MKLNLLLKVIVEMTFSKMSFKAYEQKSINC
jgi:hypothetical protein